MYGLVVLCLRFCDMLVYMGGFGFCDFRVVFGNDFDGFFFLDGCLKYLWVCENIDGEWGVLSFLLVGIFFLIKKLFCKGRYV